MCDPYVKGIFLIAIFHSLLTEISNPTLPCIANSSDVSFKSVFSDWHKCGFYLSISTDLSHYLCFIVSLNCASLMCVYLPSLHMRLWSTEFVSPQTQRSSIRISCKWHPWIFAYLAYTQWLKAYPTAYALNACGLRILFLFCFVFLLCLIS